MLSVSKFRPKSKALGGKKHVKTLRNGFCLAFYLPENANGIGIYSFYPLVRGQGGSAPLRVVRRAEPSGVSLAPHSQPRSMRRSEGSRSAAVRRPSRRKLTVLSRRSSSNPSSSVTPIKGRQVRQRPGERPCREDSSRAPSRPEARTSACARLTSARSTTCRGPGVAARARAGSRRAAGCRCRRGASATACSPHAALDQVAAVGHGGAFQVAQGWACPKRAGRDSIQRIPAGRKRNAAKMCARPRPDTCESASSPAASAPPKGAEAVDQLVCQRVHIPPGSPSETRAAPAPRGAGSRPALRVSKRCFSRTRCPSCTPIQSPPLRFIIAQTPLDLDIGGNRREPSPGAIDPTHFQSSPGICLHGRRWT